jgi:uncharacterized tellurite resistance protein B-like protein
MFDAINRLFAKPAPNTAPPDTKLAVAALLVHLGAVDGEFKAEERKTIAHLLQEHFNLDAHAVERLMAEAVRRDADAVDFYQFTSALSKLEEQERINIIRLMWQVVFADEDNHELEDNMVWRVAELIGVSTRQRTILRAEMKRK